MGLFSRNIGIDLGTVNVLCYVDGEVVLHEPTIVTIQADNQKVVAIGQEAKEMFGRAPDTMEVVRPLRDGVIADYDVTAAMLQVFLRKIIGPIRLLRPTTMLTVPWGVTSVESRAVYEAAMQAGSGTAYLIQEPLAAAVGAGLPIGTPTGNMVVNLGGGTTEAAIVALYGIVAAESARVGGIKLDEAIINYVRRKYGLVIGEPTAEDIKLRIGAAVPLDDEELSMEVQGRDQVTGLPRSVTLTSSEVAEAMQEPLGAMVRVIKTVLEKTPPELASDTIDRGMVLCGGVAQLRGIDTLITRETGVTAYVADNPVASAVIGTGKALEMLDLLRPHLPRTYH